MNRFVLFVLLALAPVGLFAQERTQGEAEDNTFGGWFFAEVNHEFRGGLYLNGLIELDNYQFRRLDCNYSRLSVGYRLLPWLKAGVNYVPAYKPEGWLHYCEADVMGTLKSGGFTVSVRERYRHGLTNNRNELRSRLKVAYEINEKWGAYLAPEVFTWGTEWKKTRHFCAFTYKATDWLQAEICYMYYAFRDDPAEHVIAFGLSFDL